MMQNVLVKITHKILLYFNHLVKKFKGSSDESTKIADMSDNFNR